MLIPGPVARRALTALQVLAISNLACDDARTLDISVAGNLVNGCTSPLYVLLLDPGTGTVAQTTDQVTRWNLVVEPGESHDFLYGNSTSDISLQIFDDPANRNNDLSIAYSRPARDIVVSGQSCNALLDGPACSVRVINSANVTVDDPNDCFTGEMSAK
jgi:hypothetical protein